MSDKDLKISILVFLSIGCGIFIGHCVWDENWIGASVAGLLYAISAPLLLRK